MVSSEFTGETLFNERENVDGLASKQKTMTRCKCYISSIFFQNYPGVDIKNFTTSWSDGLAFNAILHRRKPHLFDFNNIARKHPNARLDHAFRIAQEQLGIERLLDPEGKLDHCH